ncbi:MAG: hypothetical protein ABIQ64_00410 [Candidatus Saccharimonadales bacterium]
MSAILPGNIFLRRVMLLGAFLCSMVWFWLLSATPVSAQAITSVGPADSRTRYALEYSPTTQAETISVPVFYPTQPVAAKVVNVSSFRVGKAGIGVSFNGSASMSSPGSFSIPAASFTYDPITGFWKANVNAVMTGYSGIDGDHFIHFRMALADASGYIAYGGGYFQAVNVDYPDRDVAETYNLYMATPCDVRVNTVRNVQFYDLDHENWDNNFFSVTVRITDTTTGAVVATRAGDSYPGPMGQDGTLTVSMTFVPGHKYRVDVWGIADSNVIRYNFPFDNIAYVVPVCPTPQWNTSGSSTASPTGVVNTVVPNVTFTHTVINQASSLDPTDKTINAEIFQTINGGAPTSRGTFSRASGLPPGGNFSRADVISTAAYIGQVVCQYMQWSPGAWNSSAVRQTPQVCITIVASPRLSIVGGDAASGGNYACSTGGGGFQGNASNPGSFGEYGVLSTGDIVDFYSAGTTGGSILTFANTTPTFGNFSGTRCLTDLTGELTNNVASWDPGFSSGQAIPGGTNHYRVSSNISVGASTLNAGAKTVIDARGYSVTITGDLQYNNGSYNSFGDAPSLVILADRILVSSNVTRMDGLFIASQNLTTCDAAGDTHAVAAGAPARSAMSSTGVCRTTRLTINGALIVGGQLVTARTAGGGAATELPAEIIRFRPEVFLTPYEKGVAGGSLMTDIETELPPRN